MKKILIIIPAYNEEDSILDTVNKIEVSTSYDYIVVNDGSTDGTLEILQKHNINHINLPVNLGIGGAMQTGYKYAYRNGYDYAIQLDADGQHNPSDLENLVSTIRKEDLDLVIGSRFVEQTGYRGSKMRRFGISYFYMVIRLLAHIKVTDPTSGYRIINRKVIREFIQYYPTDYPEVEVLVYLARKGYKIKEIKVEMNQRQGGKSSITPIKSIYYMLKVSYISLVRSIF
ncbi:glycosyltransferase family 2 protein [Radiobacillus deserti]|uniref:Glycosyltransferase family 2 protein n=1 Tax=Radiobacillus deserti TaxID=2594883 RepID=A0A516KJP9_9BACI|nr:glycosyltransferase family 2 protein [Radiobacillus deserti]QDP41618.1 glycosyltransferase family 2 protein [Radiobacillus deserti]